MGREAALDAAAYLLELTHAGDALPAMDRIAKAEAGLLSSGLTEDLELLLLRHLYRGHFEDGAYEPALEVAQKMTRLAVDRSRLRDVAHHDAARALAALNRMDEAIQEQKVACHTATPSRKSFQLWTLATLQHAHQQAEEALRSLARGLEHAQRDRLLLQAHAALIHLERGTAPEPLTPLLRALAAGRDRRGYESYLYGSICFALGDHGTGEATLRAWLERVSEESLAKQRTLSSEIQRARALLQTRAPQGS